MANLAEDPRSQAFVALTHGRRLEHIEEYRGEIEGHTLFNPFIGQRVTDLAAFRLPTHDLVVIQMGGEHAAIFVANPGGFIAIEADDNDLHNNKKILGFRDDVGHGTADFYGFVATDQRVIVQDPTAVEGIPRFPDVGSFVEAALGESPEVAQAFLSFRSEDWGNVRFPNFDHLAVRADSHTLNGVVTITPDGIRAMRIGDRRGINDLSFELAAPQPLPVLT